MEIGEVKTQETALSTTAILEAVSAASDEEAITNTNVSHAEDAYREEERSNDGESESKHFNGKRSKTSKISKTSKALKGARSLTNEEKAVIIAKAEDIGAAEASREFGINYYTIYTWLKQRKKKVSSQSEQSAKPDTQALSAVQSQTQGKASKQKPSKSSKKRKAAMTTQDDEIKGSKRGYITEDVPSAPVEAVAPDKTLKTKKLNKTSEVTTGKDVSVSTVPDSPEQIDEKQALVIENAILRERISAQKAEIEKLQSAIKSLMV